MNKNFIGYILISFLFVTLGCQKHIDSASKNSILEEKIKLTFKENIEAISPIKSFEILNDSLIIVVTEKRQIILYNDKGTQVKSIKTEGEGELELLNPALVKKFGNHFYVWCDQLLKIVKFNLDGIPVQEFKGFEHAIMDFEIAENHISTYIANILGEPFIVLYHKSPLRIAGKFGFVENEQIILNFNSCAGGLAMHDNLLLYAPSNTLRIHFLDLDRLTDDKIKIFNNSKFLVTKLSEDAHLMMNNDRQKALNYSLGNSLVTGIYKLKDFFIVTTEVGQMKFNGMNLENIDREEMFIVFDKNYNLIRENLKPIKFNEPCQLIKPYKNSLYRIIVEEGKDEMEYTLKEIDFGING